jgi:putative GTP pyrophosphokinase
MREDRQVRYKHAMAVDRRASLAPSAAPFTKGQVNRAGARLLELRERLKLEATDGSGADALGIELADRDTELEREWEALRWWRSLHARPLSKVAANLRYHVDRGEGRVQNKIEVTQRLKRMDTLIGKLARESGNVTQMHDIGGVRAVLPSLRSVYVVRRRLLKSWTIIRERDYIEHPKDTGYRAMHVIVRRNGYAIEVQLRTIAQDVWANTVEEQGRERGIGFKFGEGNAELHHYFFEMAEVMARFDRGEVAPQDLREALNAVR